MKFLFTNFHLLSHLPYTEGFSFDFVRVKESLEALVGNELNVTRF